MKAMIQAAGNMVTEAKDSAGKVSLELQRIASNANQALKQVEEDFIQAETQLEDLRDTLRVMQQATV
jgi:TolA-binding protein